MTALILVPLALGVLAGYLAGGRLRHLAQTPLRHTWLLWLAAGLQFLQFQHVLPRVPLLVPVFGLVAGWLVLNLPGRGRALQVATAAVLLGAACNAAPIAANGRMPHTEAAVRAAAMTPAQLAKGAASPKHVDADATTRLLWLGDVIPVRPIRMVVSPGDVVLLLGVAGIVAAGMRRRPVGQPSRDPRDRVEIQTESGDPPPGRSMLWPCRPPASPVPWVPS